LQATKSELRENIFPYANTVVCIEDGKLLKQFQYDIFYNAKGLGATLGELNAINYFRTYKNADAENYEDMLDGLMKGTFELMEEIAPRELLRMIFALYYDIHNMKLVVKERFFGKRLDHFAFDCGGYSLPTIRSAAVRESDDILGSKELTNGFFEALRSPDVYDTDFILDKTYFRTLASLAGKLGSPGISSFITERVDLFNISVFFQALAAGKPEGYFAKAFSECGSYTLAEWEKYLNHGELNPEKEFALWYKYRPIWESAENNTQLFSEFDVLCDNYLINKTKACKLTAFGIEPIYAYFYNKFMEIKNIRILLTGKKNNYGTDEIKKRMRIPYEL